MTGRRRPMRRLSDVLPEVASQLGLDDELRLSRAMATWERLVGELIPGASGASRVVEIRPPTLIVSAADTIVGQELRLNAHDLLEAFAMAPGGSRLLKLRVVVRPGGRGLGDGSGSPGRTRRNG